MALHEHERDLLEDTMCRRLADLWSEFSDAISVFDANTAAQQLCALKVWEALPAAFPFKHKDDDGLLIVLAETKISSRSIYPLGTFHQKENQHM
jgi:hypothetical protein